MVHEISQLSRSTSKVDLNTNSAKNEAMEYIHQMQELWYQSSRAIRETWLHGCPKDSSITYRKSLLQNCKSQETIPYY